MNKTDKETFIVLGAGGLLVSFIPFIPEPYYHVDRVNFWEWIIREINEVLYGERARLGYYTFEPMLRKYLRLHNPRNILEWGPGFSTKVMLEELPEAQIYTIEHDAKWISAWSTEMSNPNVHLNLLALDNNYYEAPLTWGMSFDLVFVDGADPRILSLNTALQVINDNGLIILHDWETYQNEIQSLKIIEKDDYTAVMMK